MDHIDAMDELRQGIDELLEIKKVTQESDLNPQIPVIQDFIASELVKQKELADSSEDDRNMDWTALNKLFYDVIREG